MSDRWRYCCPDCGSVSVYTRRTQGAREPYYCQYCNDPKPEKWDKKREVLV